VERKWQTRKISGLPSAMPHIERNIMGMYQHRHGAFYKRIRYKAVPYKKGDVNVSKGWWMNE
jgi:hypothetical protein